MGLLDRLKEYISSSRDSTGKETFELPKDSGQEDEEQEYALLDDHEPQQLRRQKYPRHTGTSVIDDGIEAYEDHVGSQPDPEQIDNHMGSMEQRLEEKGIDISSYAKRLRGHLKDHDPEAAAYVAKEYIQADGAQDMERHDAEQAYSQHWRDPERQLRIAERHDLGTEKKKDAAESLVWGDSSNNDIRKRAAEKYLDQREMDYVYSDIGKKILGQIDGKSYDEKEDIFNQYTFRELRNILHSLHSDEQEEMLHELQDTTAYVLGRFGLDIPDDINITTEQYKQGASYDPKENTVKIGTGMRTEDQLEDASDSAVYTDTMPSLAVVGHEFIHARQGRAQHRLREHIDQQGDDSPLHRTDFVRDIHRTITGHEAYQKAPLLERVPDRFNSIIDLAEQRHQTAKQAGDEEKESRYVELLDQALKREMDIHDIDADIREAEKEATAHLFSLVYAERITDPEMRQQYIEHTGNYMDTQSDDAAEIFLQRWDQMREHGRSRKKSMEQIFREMNAIHDLATHDIDDYLREFDHESLQDDQDSDQ